MLHRTQGTTMNSGYCFRDSFLGKIHEVTPPKVYPEAGICSKDVPVVLYIKADDGYTYRSDANGPDGFDHAMVTAEGDGSFTVAFEDLYNGGDKDYNDARLNVVCTPNPINAPEFPAMALPVVLIIGMLGVVLVIRRNQRRINFLAIVQ